MNNNLTPQIIAAWLRERGKKYIETADMLEQDLGFGQLGVKMSHSNANAPTIRTTPLTIQEFENSVKEKSGRVNDLAERLGTTPTQIHSLLDPASKVIIGERGWLKIKE